MKAQSMTGYGRGTAGSIKVEVRSVNHKNLDLHVNLPSFFFAYEGTVKKVLRNMFSRGRIDVNIIKADAGSVKVKINNALAREYYDALNALRNELSLSGEIGVNILAGYREIFCTEEEADINELNSALEIALDELKQMRVGEGSTLVHDIKERSRLLYKFICDLENKRDLFIAETRQRLYERLKEFLEDTSIDDSRLVQETAIIVEKSDITEEIVRVKSHLEHLDVLLDSGNDAIGKKVDFIVQELRREVNTISSKSRNAEISMLVVEMKYELEKIREQTQNLQ